MACGVAETPPPPPATPAPETRLCSGHVTGTRGSGHISWIAYASEDTAEVLTARYEKALGPPAGRDGRCAVWRDSKGKPSNTTEVCPASARGRPWSDCPSVPQRTRSVVLKATFAD